MARTEPRRSVGDDTMLSAVAFSAEQLLLADDWREVIDDVLLRLGTAAGVSRAYLIHVDAREAGASRATQLAEWCAPGVSSQFDNPILQGAPLESTGFARWVAMLADHETVHGIVRDLPDAERIELERQDIASIAAFPVFVDGAWWALVGFDDCVHERTWSDFELDSLRAVAGMLGAAEHANRATRGWFEAESRYAQLVDRADVADQVETEERLRRAEARYRAMVERIPAVTYTDLVDPDGVTFMGFVSPQIEEILGYPPQAFLDRADLWFEIIHPDDLAHLRAIDAFNNADLAPFEHEYRMRHADGHWVWVHDTSTAVLREDGSLDYFLGFLTDVTSFHDAEERAREAELTFRTMVEQNPAVFYIQEVDPDDPAVAITTYVGPGHEQLTGHPRNATVENRTLWHSLIHPDDRQRVLAAEAASGTDGTDTFSEEYRIVRRDGQVVWLLDRAGLVRPEGRDPYWQGFLLDVTARKEAERRLRDAHAHLRLMVDSALDAVVSMDVDGVITAWNPQAEATFGWSAEEAIGRPLAETIVPHGQRAAHRQGLTRWRETGASTVLNSRIEIQALHRDGRLIPVELAIVPVAVGDEIVFSGFIRDISDRKRAQEDLERALEVEREAIARLRTLDEMKDTFLQAVSHDLRTPLAAILGLAITLERDDVGLEAQERRRLAGRIEHNARRLERLVTNLLDLDRLSRGVLTPSFEPADVGELVGRMVAEADPSLPDRVELTTEPAVVPIDPPKVERIVENLLVNAAKHTPPGTPVHVSVAATPDGAVIAVEDEGRGVPDELREKIFEEFRQGTDAPQASPGVGVGLTLVRRFAEMHHGRAWVEEREGGGASFRVFLPAVHPAEPVEPVAGSVA
ncbi:MAG TPA: PAS domain S-box protein [Actinomycetota bacterium]|nr:PAS domain S-box protein [Actinomycetota bacterium]